MVGKRLAEGAEDRVVVCPGLFRLPWFRRFDGYAAWGLILLRRPPGEADGDLLTHELCHVWQLQHRPVAMPLSYLRHGYLRNPYEQEARKAVETAHAIVTHCITDMAAMRASASAPI